MCFIRSTENHVYAPELRFADGRMGCWVIEHIWKTNYTKPCLRAPPRSTAPARITFPFSLCMAKSFVVADRSPHDVREERKQTKIVRSPAAMVVLGRCRPWA